LAAAGRVKQSGESVKLLIRRPILLCALIAVSSLPGAAQFKTKLKPQTALEFQAYAESVEARLSARWNGKASFLQVTDDPAALQRVMNGELWVQPELQPNPRAISDGLIHDWYGAVFIPNATLARVLSVLEDFEHHAQIYPQVTRSRLIKRTGNDFVGYWRLEEKGQILPAVFDVTQNSHYEEVAPGRWIGLSHADDIQAVENARTLPPGEGNGFMWKLYSYWTLQQVGNGVVAECRTISLSRGIPGTFAWMIRPFMNTIPRDSMDSTLRCTRKASGE
jgi:hypothetical protein